jgi:hypothetical protein
VPFIRSPNIAQTGNRMHWLWPVFTTIEDAERSLRGAARVWFVLALIMLVTGFAPTVLATVSAATNWPILIAYASAILAEFAAMVLLCRLMATRRSRLLALGLLLIFAWGFIGTLADGEFDLVGLALLAGIGLVTANALRAANAWHDRMGSRIRWDHLGIAMAVFVSLLIAAFAVDADAVLGWEYPEPSGRSAASMLLENAAIFATAAVTRWLPVVSFPAGGPAGCDAAGREA